MKKYSIAFFEDYFEKKTPSYSKIPPKYQKFPKKFTIFLEKRKIFINHLYLIYEKLFFKEWFMRRETPVVFFLILYTSWCIFKEGVNDF